MKLKILHGGFLNFRLSLLCDLQHYPKFQKKTIVIQIGWSWITIIELPFSFQMFLNCHSNWLILNCVVQLLDVSQVSLKFVVLELAVDCAPALAPF